MTKAGESRKEFSHNSKELQISNLEAYKTLLFAVFM